MNWERFTSDFLTKKNIWELLVKWNQIKFKGKSNERKIEIRRKEKKIEERKEKKRLASLARAVLGKVIQLFQYAAVMRDGGWWWMGEEEFSPHSIQPRGSRRSAPTF